MTAKKDAIQLLYVGKSTFGPRWDAGHHQHAHLEILGLIGGTLSLEYGGTTSTVKSPALILYNQGAVHREQVGAGTVELLYAAVMVRNGGNCLKQGNPVVVGSYGKIKSALRYFHEALGECNKKDFGWEEAARGCMARVLRAAFSADAGRRERAAPVRSGRGKVIAAHIKKYIESNYHRQLGLKEMAETMYLNPYYLGHVFKDETGYSPVQYAIRTKIKKARELLKDPRLNVSEVAYAVGYESVHHFNRIFSLVEGVPPGTYRRKNMKASS